MKIIFKRNANDSEMWDMMTLAGSPGMQRMVVWATVMVDFFPDSDQGNMDEIVMEADVVDG